MRRVLPPESTAAVADGNGGAIRQDSYLVDIRKARTPWRRVALAKRTRRPSGKPRGRDGLAVGGDQGAATGPLNPANAVPCSATSTISRGKH